MGAGRQSRGGDSAGSKLQNPSRALRRDYDAPGRDIFCQCQNAHLTAEEHNVDVEAHAERVNAATWHEKQAFLLGHASAT
jgi:hypothetical protein